MPVTNYIRFFHIETHHLTFCGIETLVTLLVLFLFVVLPARFPGGFPHRSKLLASPTCAPFP
jgi:hypothetical protein